MVLTVRTRKTYSGVIRSQLREFARVSEQILVWQTKHSGWAGTPGYPVFDLSQVASLNLLIAAVETALEARRIG